MIIPGSQAIQSEKSLIALLICISTEIAIVTAISQ